MRRVLMLWLMLGSSVALAEKPAAHAPPPAPPEPAAPAPKPACVEEAALSEAAAELLLLGKAPSDDALASAVRDAGSDAVLVRALYTVEAKGSAEGGAYARWLSEAQTKADGALACGDAKSERGELHLIAPRGGALEPIASKEPVVHGTLAKGFVKPALVIVDGDGESQRIDLSAEALANGVALDPDLPRPVHVQLIAKGPLGPRPLAERVLGHVAVDKTEAHDTLVGAPDLEPMSQLAIARGEASRGGLRTHSLLTQVAMKHAARVCAEGRVAHELEPGADPQARLRAEGVGARRVGETIARDRDAPTAFARMLQSPAHRMTLLEPGFTDVGIGEARDDRGRVCLVVLLAAWPRYIGK